MTTPDHKDKRRRLEAENNTATSLRLSKDCNQNAGQQSCHHSGSTDGFRQPKVVDVDQHERQQQTDQNDSAHQRDQSRCNVV